MHWLLFLILLFRRVSPSNLPQLVVPPSLLAMSDFIPEHLMPEILKWLPVKSLARFRCVRRSWNDLITSASFIADHLACSSMKPQLLVGYHRVPLVIEEVLAKRYFLLDSEMLEVNAKTLLSPFEMITASGVYLWTHYVVGSVNGVICLTNWKIYPGIVLWNPLIRKYIPLPRDDPPFGHRGCRELLGFGVNESDHDFRVIRVCYITVYDEAVEDTDYPNLDPYIVDQFYVVEVCSARDRIWRALDTDILENCHILENEQLPQCLVNGVVHWIVGVEDDSDDGGSTTNTLLLFDFEKEVLGFLALPENLANTYHSNLQVRRFRGMLGVLKYDRGCDWRCYDIWAMNEYGDVSSWSFLIRVNISGVTREPHEGVGGVLGLTEGGQILISQRVDDKPNSDYWVFLYNLANRTRRLLQFEEKIMEIYVPDFVESLIFMDSESGAVSPPAL